MKTRILYLNFELWNQNRLQEATIVFTSAEVTDFQLPFVRQIKYRKAEA